MSRIEHEMMQGEVGHGCQGLRIYRWEIPLHGTLVSYALARFATEKRREDVMPAEYDYYFQEYAHAREHSLECIQESLKVLKSGYQSLQSQYEHEFKTGDRMRQSLIYREMENYSRYAQRILRLCTRELAAAIESGEEASLEDGGGGA
jgi:hypothetical protein